MIKNIISGLLLVVAATSAAQAQENTVRRIYRQNEQVYDLIKQKAHRLDFQSQRELLERLRGIKDLVNGDRPQYPLPHPPSRDFSYIVRGEIQSRTFSFEGTDLFSLFQSCSSFYKAQSIGVVNDIKFSVNFAPTEVLKNSSSYWRSANEVCSQLNSAYAAAGVSYSGFDLLYIGTIQGRDFMFKGRNIIEINQQCDAFAKNIGVVNHIQLSVNLGKVTDIKNPSGYWRSNFEVCQQVLQQR